MKFSLVLFGIYLVILPLAPCSDREECNKEFTELVSLPADCQDEHKDDCSPSCSCSCCPGTVFIFLENKPAEINFPSTSQNGHFNSFNHSEVLNMVWQPPRLV